MKRSVLALIVMASLCGCDALGPDEDEYGLNLDIVNDPQIPWRIENITRDETIFHRLEDVAENTFLSACKYRNDECEVKLVAIPLISLPAGCRKWHFQYADFDIPYYGRSHTQWHLEKPRAFECEEKEDDKH